MALPLPSALPDFSGRSSVGCDLSTGLGQASWDGGGELLFWSR